MADDYVKRSDVHKVFQPKYAPAINRTFAAMIDSVPAADVVEVVHARPVKFYCNARTGRMMTTCSACDMKIGPYDSFCKNCGAKLDGGQE